MRYFWTLTFCLFCATAMASPLTVDRVPKATASAVIEDGQIVDNGANVGIGTTNPQKKLEVIGTVKATSFVGDGSGLSGVATIPSQWSGTTGSDIYYSLANVGVGSSKPQGKLDVNGFIYASGEYLSDTGNTGIGTSAPRQKLDVNGTVIAAAFVGNGSLLTNLPASTMVYPAAGVPVSIGTAWQGSSLAFSGTGSSVVTNVSPTVSGSASFATVLMSGNLGIGSSAPAAKVDIIGGSASSFWSNVGIGTSDPQAALEIVGSLDHSYFSGNIGIGSSAPRIALDVVGTVYGTRFVGDGSGLSNLGTSIQWTTNGTGIYYNTGNVGIGSSAPHALLDIYSASGLSYFGGNVGIGSTNPGAILVIPSLKSNSGTRYLIIDNVGNVSSSTTAPSGT